MIRALECLTVITVLTAAFAVPSNIRAEEETVSPTAVPRWPDFTRHKVTKQELAAAKKAGVDIYTHLFADRAETIKRFNRLDPKFIRAGKRLLVPDIPEGEEYVPLPLEYPPAAEHERYILVALNKQFLGLYEFGKLIASYPVVSGVEKCTDTDGTERSCLTPRGLTTVTRKDADHYSDKYPEPDGGSPMPWALRFRGSGYWIHGGDMVGYRASHGCVRMFAEDAEKLFNEVEIGTPVRVVDPLR
jgi:lipoprotein-anchoring transpeptidase ErfK/SrfK